jgi:hypothetical protein
VPLVCAAQCREAPTVQMDERAAESHLLAKKDPELTARGDQRIRLRRVVVLVTVDRKGVICDVRPVEGPKELQQIAVKAVKKYWKYRPFLVNWKPVVAQFPVSITFVDPKPEPELKAQFSELRGEIGQAAA